MSVSISRDRAEQLVTQAGKAYHSEKSSEARHKLIKRVALGVGGAALALLAFEGHSIPVTKAEHTVTVGIELAADGTYLYQRHKQQGAQSRAASALQDAIWYIDPRAMGDSAAPLQSWIVDALPADESTDELIHRAGTIQDANAAHPPLDVSQQSKAEQQLPD